MSRISLDDGLERTRVEGLKIVRATAMKTLYGAFPPPSPRNLADSGQFGLSFVTLQADTLFWQILPVLAYTRATSIELNASHVLVQVLTHECVSWALDDLLTQINALANLG